MTRGYVMSQREYGRIDTSMLQYETKKAIPAIHMNEENACFIVEQHDDILHLTISNPALRNALDPSSYETGIEVIRAAHHDSGVRAIILSGADGQFCGGGNLHRLKKTRKGAASVQFDGISKFHSWIEAISDCPKPVIAAVEGACAGGGFSLALACDLHQPL